MNYKNNINVGGYPIHVQGIATDDKREHMYFSFTTSLIKTDMDGNVLGSVTGLMGHLGCIAFHDGKVYGSLEYKHDVIGRAILGIIDKEGEWEDGFYAAIFDVEKIDRMDMDAEKDGVMTAVYLKEVLKDYSAPGNHYGCAGMDGMTFAPIPGDPSGKLYLYAAYGIYSDVDREDNDYQVIVRYDTADWDRYAKPLTQSDMHRNGPDAPDDKYFVYTGNTAFGIQNLEYDSATNYMFAAVYVGQKPQFPNYPMFAIDLTVPAEEQELRGIGERGKVLSLAPIGEYDSESGVRGSWFPYGSTGMISLGDGNFYFSHNYGSKKGQFTTVKLHRYDPEKMFV